MAGGGVSAARPRIFPLAKPLFAFILMAMLFLAALSPESQLHGALLLAGIIALGLLGVWMIVGLGLARRRHWRRMEEEHRPVKKEPPVDPWEEAGRRMEVPKESPETEKNDEINLP